MKPSEVQLASFPFGEACHVPLASGGFARQCSLKTLAAQSRRQRHPATKPDVAFTTQFLNAK